MSFGAEMSEDTIMENGDSDFSNTVFGSADISGGDPSMISGPNMASSSSSSFMSVGHYQQQQISTASGHGDDDDDELIVSNASSRILNDDDFREFTSIGGGAVNNETSNMLEPISIACFEAIQQNNLNLADSLIADLTKFADSQTEDMKKVASDFAQALDGMIIHRMNNPQRRSLKLKFLRKVSVSVFTGKKIKGEGGGTAIHVALVDDISGEIINYAPQTSAIVEIVVLRGDFGGDNWTSGEFNSNILRNRENTDKPLLAKTTHLRLNRGIGLLDKIKFAHYPSFTRSTVFCLGARVIACFNGTRLKEAKTEPFTVKDSRLLACRPRIAGANLLER